jgi:hypothetical protein
MEKVDWKIYLDVIHLTLLFAQKNEMLFDKNIDGVHRTTRLDYEKR